MNEKRISWRIEDSPENKKKCRVETRMINKSYLRGHADCIMSNMNRNACEFPCEEMLKVIDKSDFLDLTEDKFRH